MVDALGAKAAQSEVRVSTAEKGRVVILGGHGKIALLAAPKLKDAGYAVESVIRSETQSSDIEAAGASPVVLDLENADAEALKQVFSGAQAVVFSAGAGGGSPERTRSVDFEAAARTMDAAEAAGVKRYVMVSYAGAGVDVDRLDPEDEPKAMWRQAGWKRVAVLLAGPVMNIVLAILLFYVVAVGWGLANRDVQSVPAGEVAALVGETCEPGPVASGAEPVCGEGVGPAGAAGSVRPSLLGSAGWACCRCRGLVGHGVQPPVGHAQAAVRAPGHGVVMGDDQDGGALVGQVAQVLDDLLGDGLVQVPGGLIGQQHGGGRGDSAGDGHPLPLTPGEGGAWGLPTVTQT